MTRATSKSPLRLLDSRTVYKPMSYPWCFDYAKLQQQVDWMPDEVPLHDDVKDWSQRLSPAERNLLTQLFRFFTQQDVDVACGYRTKYLPIFGGHPEVAMMLFRFAAMEGTHIEAYALLLDTIGMPETEYAAFQQFDEMKAKHEFLFAERKTGDHIFDLALDLAMFSGFAEGLQLFSSFAILLNFPRFGKMRGMGQIVSWSVRDESMHVEAMIRVFKTLLSEYGAQIAPRMLRERVWGVCFEMVEMEDKFIDLAFAQGGIEGLDGATMKRFIRYIANRRLDQLGLPTLFEVAENPLPWFDEMVSAQEHTNFFENRATDYSRSTLAGDWSDVWGSRT